MIFAKILTQIILSICRIAQEEAKLLGRYLFEPRVFYQVEDINRWLKLLSLNFNCVYRIEKAKFIETRLRKFVGQYEVVSDSIVKILKEFIQKPENKQKKTELIEKINEVK